MMNTTPSPEFDATPGPRSPTLLSTPVTTIDGEPTTLDQYRGRTLLIVNVASKCGYTPQYSGLESLYRRYRERGLTILGFPCDQFGNQEPGTEADIKEFCSLSYGVSFPMFAKVDVNGPNEHSLYKQLKTAAPGVLGTTAVKWNFTKFLVNRDGRVTARYSPRDTPEDIEEDAAFRAALG